MFLFLKRRILKICFLLFLNKTLIPNCGLTLAFEVMIWKTRNMSIGHECPARCVLLMVHQTRGPWATSLTWVLKLRKSRNWFIIEKLKSKSNPMINHGFAFLQRIFHIFLCKTLVGQFGPALPPGVMIWTNLNLHYLRMLPYKYDELWLGHSWEEDF